MKSHEWPASCFITGGEPQVLTGQEAEWTPELVWMLWRREKYPSPVRKPSRYNDSAIQVPEMNYIKFICEFVFCNETEKITNISSYASFLGSASIS
jgi:hypothetical protein